VEQIGRVVPEVECANVGAEASQNIGSATLPIDVGAVAHDCNE
jgi:hypothetical protein